MASFCWWNSTVLFFHLFSTAIFSMSHYSGKLPQGPWTYFSATTWGCGENGIGRPGGWIPANRHGQGLRHRSRNWTRPSEGLPGRHTVTWPNLYHNQGKTPPAVDTERPTPRNSAPPTDVLSKILANNVTQAGSDRLGLGPGAVETYQKSFSFQSSNRFVSQLHGYNWQHVLKSPVLCSCGGTRTHGKMWFQRWGSSSMICSWTTWTCTWYTGQQLFRSILCPFCKTVRKVCRTEAGVLGE